MIGEDLGGESAFGAGSTAGGMDCEGLVLDGDGSCNRSSRDFIREEGFSCSPAVSMPESWEGEPRDKPELVVHVGAT